MTNIKVFVVTMIILLFGITFNLVEWLFCIGPDHFIYTHRRGWIHISDATAKDRQETSGFMSPYVRQLWL